MLHGSIALITYGVASVADPVRKVSWILFQEGRSSELRLRRGVEQAVHTLKIIPK